MNILNATLREESGYDANGEWYERYFVHLHVDYITVAVVEVEDGCGYSEKELIAQGLTKLFADLPAVQKADH